MVEVGNQNYRRLHGCFFSETTSDYYGSAIIPEYMLKTNWTWCNDWLLALPIVHARTNSILKVMKAISIPWHDFFLNYFWNELDGSLAIFTNLQIFYFLGWSARSCVDEPKCKDQFLAMGIQVKPHIMHETLTLSSVPCGFQSSEGHLDPLLQMYAPHYSFQSKWDPAVSSHLFPFSAIQHPQRCLLSGGA